MKDIKNTILEMINHLLQDQPELGPTIKLLAENSYAENRSGQKYYGLNNLDEKLEKFLNYESGYFVEIGANNGVDQSNTIYYEKFKKWRGILVEPTPHNYLACKRHRSSENHIYCNACVSFDYKEKFVEIVYSNLMSTPLGLESDIENPVSHAGEGRKFLNPSDDNFKFGALAVPLNTLLTQSNAPKLIDFLSLDAEGAEMEILKGIDHDNFRFKYMCIENRSIEKLKEYLVPLNYVFVEALSPYDFLFKDTRE